MCRSYPAALKRVPGGRGPSGRSAHIPVSVSSCPQDDRCRTPLCVLASLMPAPAVPVFRCLPPPPPPPREELWGAWGRLPSQVPGGVAQPSLLGPQPVNSALGLTYFLGEKIEYRFKCSGALENYRPSSVRK